jgi:hypothetical protein
LRRKNAVCSYVETLHATSLHKMIMRCGLTYSNDAPVSLPVHSNRSSTAWGSTKQFSCKRGKGFIRSNEGRDSNPTRFYHGNPRGQIANCLYAEQECVEATGQWPLHFLYQFIVEAARNWPLSILLSMMKSLLRKSKTANDSNRTYD